MADYIVIAKNPEVIHYYKGKEMKSKTEGLDSTKRHIPAKTSLKSKNGTDYK